MIYEEEDFDGVESIEEIEEAKASLRQTITDASAKLSELEELTDGLEKLSEDDEEDTDGGWIFKDYITIEGSTRGQRTSECVQSFTVKCGTVKKIQLLTQSRPGMGFARRGNYLYVVRRNSSIRGMIQGLIIGSRRDARVIWNFK